MGKSRGTYILYYVGVGSGTNFLVDDGGGHAKLSEKEENEFKGEVRYVNVSGFALWRTKQTPFLPLASNNFFISRLLLACFIALLKIQ